jgi:DNA-binding MarR family transcriptional regulator
MPPTSSRSPAAALRRALRELTRVQQLRDRSRAAAAGLTATGAHALEVLAERGPLSLTALSAELCVDRSTGCRVVGLLEDRGWVARAADARDGRAIAVALTEAGRALETRLRGQAVREAAALLDAVPGADARLLHALARASAEHAGAVKAFKDDDD